ncbi:unnamed protein product, partial [marine sediment metagenome]
MSEKENNNKPKEKRTSITLDSQKRMFASLLFSKETPDDIQDIRPEHFDSIAVRVMVKLFCDAFKEYPTMQTASKIFHQRLATFLGNKEDKDLPISRDELADVYEEILLLEGEDFEPVRDLFRELARQQAHNKAIDKIIEKKMVEKGNYDDIHRLMIEAYDTGSKDGGLRKLSDIEAKDVEWLWENHIPLGEITILAGDPGIGKSYFSYFLSAQVSIGGFWPDAPNTAIENGKVLILSTDEDPHYAIRPRS